MSNADTRAGGTGVGCGSAVGRSLRNAWKWERERESAAALSRPGTWRAENEKWNLQATRTRRRIRCMDKGSREEPELMMATTAWLSQRNSTCKRAHWHPQTCAATTMGNNSNAAILEAGTDAGQDPASHALRQKAPKPWLPEESEATNRSGKEQIDGRRKKLTPFQEWRNSSHQARSRRNSQLRRIGWDGDRKAHNRSIMRRRKVRPGGTTLVTWWREPINDSSSVRVHHFLDAHWLSSSKCWLTCRGVSGPSGWGNWARCQEKLTLG